MKCLGCGNELNDGQTTCPYCGNSVSNANPMNQVNQWQGNQGINSPNNNPMPQNNYQPENEKKSNIGGIIIVLIFIGAIIFGIWFMAFSGGSKENKENEENNSNSQNTEYNEENNIIENSKRAAYADTVSAFIAATRNKVNEGRSFQLYSQDDLYMIPIGNDNKSCVSVEGGSSPYSNSWNFAYVGVTYDGSGYSYYYIGEDGDGNGFEFTDYMSLAKGQIDTFYNKKNPSTKSFISSLKEQYLKTSEGTKYHDTFTSDSEYSELLNNVSKKKIKFVLSGECKYKGSID